ncbi:unnamed protein product [Closterium sp. NIES-65]|nr:unnamed protein product [Closterium sp. NIES-65]
MSHIIYSLGFLVPYPGRLNPLDGLVCMPPPLKEGEDPARSSDMFKYFLKVVLTRFRFWHGGTVKTNQYSISEYFTPSSPQSIALPVYFLYYRSPIAVSITESHQSFFHFLTRLCAVLRGTFALIGGWGAQVGGAHRWVGRTREWGAQVGGAHRWVGRTGGWGAQVGGAHMWVGRIGGWGAQMGGAHRWVRHTRGWGAEVGGAHKWVHGRGTFALAGPVLNRL